MPTKMELFGDNIREAVDKHIDKLGAVYTDVIMDETDLTRELITTWLKGNGFTKTSGHTSRRWVNELRRSNG